MREGARVGEGGREGEGEGVPKRARLTCRRQPDTREQLRPTRTLSSTLLPPPCLPLSPPFAGLFETTTSVKRPAGKIGSYAYEFIRRHLALWLGWSRVALITF